MINHSDRIGIQLDGAVILFGFLLLGLLLASLGVLGGEALVHLLEIRHLAIELLEVEAEVKRPDRLVCDSVTRRDAIDHCTSFPIISGIIRSIGFNPTQEWNLTERSLITGCEGLSISPWRTQAFNRSHHRVAPIAVLVGKQFPVDLSDGLHDTGRCIAVKRHRERLCKVPRERKGAIPQKSLTDRHGQVDINSSLVTRLLLMIETRDVGIESDAGR